MPENCFDGRDSRWNRELLGFLRTICPIGPLNPPAAYPVRRVPLSQVLPLTLESRSARLRPAGTRKASSGSRSRNECDGGRDGTADLMEP